ncbi:MAG TPA: tryptophan synthase subunit alpha [Thermoplasmata archaeon]|nr:tryptophan synthase subunit alpha [Thermoplasmata archaeon]
MRFEKAFRPRALVAYLMGFDPDREKSLDYLEAAARGGADIIEIGVAFSDPIADGPTIQAAGMRALRSGSTPRGCIELARDLKSRVKVPVALMTYYNPIIRMGEEEFVRQAAKAGVDGLIVPDLPVDEAHSLRASTKKHDLDLIFLATPPTPDARLAEIARDCSGFLYLVSRYGTTGTRGEFGEGLPALVKRVKRVADSISPGLPVAVGFGISTAAQVAEVIRDGADGAIIGSVLVDMIAQGARPSDVQKHVAELRKGLSG